MAKIQSNPPENTASVLHQATETRRSVVQTTITGEPHNPLLPPHNRRRIPRNNEHQNAFRRNNNRNTLVQATLQGEDLAAKDSEAFGDPFPPHPGKNCTIITFQNIGPQRYSLYNQTSTATSKAFKDSQAGIALYAECSLMESLLQAGNSFNDRMRVRSPNSFSRLTNNINERDKAKWFQRGGAAFSVQNNIKAHQVSHGNDKSGLGRWIWTRLRGKGTAYTRMVSAYRPCFNKGIGTVWTQHCRYMRAANQVSSPDPIQQFDIDLTAEIQKWKLMGDNIIIGIDMNEDVRDCNLSKVLQENDFRNAILTAHPSESPPATFNRNRSRIPIDAIWVTPNLDITRAGFMPFDGGSPSAPSDGHRMLWIEVDNYSFLGKHIPTRTSPLAASRVKSNDPRSVRRYHRILRNQYRKKHIFTTTKKLNKEKETFLATSTATKEERNKFLISFEKKFNSHHKLTRQIRQAVDKQMRQIFAGGTEYSPEFQVLRDTIEFWSRITKLKKQINTSRITIKRMAKKLKLTWATNPTITLQAANLHLTRAYKDLRKAKPNAHKKRLEFQKDQIKTLTEPPPTKKQFKKGLIDALTKEEVKLRKNPDPTKTRIQIEARIKREQKARVMGLAARNIRRKNMKDPVLRAVASDPEGNTYECNSQESMIKAMSSSNSNRQQQCKQTPFQMAPLLDIMGYLMDNDEIAQQVMDGTFSPPEGTDPVAAELLETLQMENSVRSLGTLDMSITPDDNRSGWKKQKERTASEPTGLGFNHYKTSCLTDDLNEVDSFLRTAPLQLGISPKLWRVITDFQIFKRSNVFHVDSMRLIQLMDAEYNMCNKTLGKRVLAHAEKAKAVSPDQYGCRKNHTAINACLNKVLLMDGFRQKRQSGAIAMNDAKGCFDRINHTFAILVLMSFGVSAVLARSLFETLQKADHHIKTGYGRSDKAYGNNDEPEPHQGIGQGNGLGPTLWALLSSILIKNMKRHNHGVNLLSAMTLSLVSIVCFAFVDDTDLVSSGKFRHSTGEESSEEFQSALDRWSRSLIVSGGALCPVKSFCYLIDFHWTGTDFVYRTKDDMPGSFTLIDKNGNREILTRLEVWQAQKTLGFFLAMDGNQRAQFLFLREKSIEFGDQIRSSKCDKNTALYTYNSCFMKSIEYCMTTTNFSESEWNTILAPALKYSLQKSGMSSNFPHNVLYGPSLYQGLNIKHPKFWEGLKKISTHIQESVNQSSTGSLIRLTAEGLRLELGIPMTPGTIEWKIVKEYTTPAWYGGILDFISNHPIEIIEDYPQLPLLRQNDQYIMQGFINAGYRKLDLKILNFMRMSLRAVTVADIASSSGYTINHLSWELKQGNGLREHYDWPRDPPSFTTSQVKLWKSALTAAFIQPHSISTHRKLAQPVSIWQSLSPLQDWLYFFSPDEDRLYRKHNKSWKIYSYHRGAIRNRRYKFSNQICPTKPPSANRLASISPRHAPRNNSDLILIALESHTHWHYETPDDDLTSYNPAEGPFGCIHDAFDSSIASEKILLDVIDLPKDNCQAISIAIKNGTARAISDGSYDPLTQKGTSSLTIVADKNDKNPLEGDNWVPGTPTDQSAYRSELAGITGILSAVAIIIQHYDITEGSITIALDGSSALDQASADNPLKIDQPDFDILQDIRARLHLLPIKVEWRWVEGHQDEKGKMMDWWALQNQKVDRNAKAFLQKCKQNKRQHRPVRLLHEKWALYIKGVKQSKIDKNSLYASLFAPRTLSYWENHHDIKIDPYATVDWEASRLALAKLPQGYKRWLVKQLSGHIGVGHMLKKRKWQDHSRCPLCNTENEKTSHVLLCQNKASKDNFKKSLEVNLTPTMKSTKTAPSLQKTILLILLKWREGKKITPSDHPQIFGIREAVRDQNKYLGWNNFILGRWSPKWQTVQQQFYTHTKSKRTSKRWASSIIHKLLLTVWDQWKFRNKIAHSDEGPRAKSLHRSLNVRILEEFQEGNAQIPAEDKYLFRAYSYLTLQAMPREDKQQWLESVNLARKAINYTNAPTPQLAVMRNLMQNWLN